MIALKYLLHEQMDASYAKLDIAPSNQNLAKRREEEASILSVGCIVNKQLWGFECFSPTELGRVNQAPTKGNRLITFVIQLT